MLKKWYLLKIIGIIVLFSIFATIPAPYDFRIAFIIMLLVGIWLSSLNHKRLIILAEDPDNPNSNRASKLKEINNLIESVEDIFDITAITTFLIIFFRFLLNIWTYWL